MIKTDTAYKRAIKNLKELESHLLSETERFRRMELSEKQVELAIAPLVSYYHEYKEDITAYENHLAGQFAPITNIREVGSLLIGYRLYRGMSQAELAKKAGVAVSQVSRDENNEYHGSSIDKIAKIMDALEMNVALTVNK